MSAEQPPGSPPPGGGAPPPPPPPGGSPPPPPPPPPGGMPPPPPSTGSSPDVGGAISWAFTKFGQNAPVMLVFAAIVLVIQLISSFTSNRLNSVSDSTITTTETPTTGQAFALFGLGIGSLILGIALWALAVLATIGLINASLKLTRGEKPTFGDFWEPRHFWVYVFVSIVFALAWGFGLLLCVIPGLLILWIWQFAQYAALDPGQGFSGSFGESYRLVMANKGPAVVTLLVYAVAALVTVITCGIGALVVMPFQTLFMANMYKQFRGEPVAA